MTEPTYEVNYERLSQLSIADLTGLITLFKLYPPHIYKDEAKIYKSVFDKELEKRINDIIIF